MLCAKFSWNWPSDSVEDFHFWKFRQCIFAIIFSKHLNKLEFPSYKNALCHVMLELAQWRFFKFCYCIFAISLSSPLGKVGALQLNPLNPNANLVEIGSVVVEKTTDTDKLWSEKVTWTFGSGELKSKNRTQDHCRATSSHNHWATQSFKLQRCFS